MGNSVELCAVQLPGRENRLREPPINELEFVVQELLSAIRDYLDIPFVFFGHSMGALLAFEMARKIRHELRLEPELLVVSAAAAPHLSLTSRPLAGLPDAELVAELRRQDPCNDVVFHNVELMTIALPAIRSDLTLVETYAYRADGPLGCRVLAFGGRQDDTVEESELAAWSAQSICPFRLKMFDGYHMFLREEQRAVCREIRRILEER